MYRLLLRSHSLNLVNNLVNNILPGYPLLCLVAIRRQPQLSLRCILPLHRAMEVLPSFLPIWVQPGAASQCLPKYTSLLIHNVTKKWTRLDQVFISDHSLELIKVCDVIASKRGINTDHLPILTSLNLATTISEASVTHNFRDVDWEEFNRELTKQLNASTPVAPINTQSQLNSACTTLTKALQDTITKAVPVNRICAKTKRWWTKELTLLRRKADKLGRNASKLKHLPHHHIHAEHTDAVRKYRNTLETTKKQHWRDSVGSSVRKTQTYGR